MQRASIMLAGLLCAAALAACSQAPVTPGDAGGLKPLGRGTITFVDDSQGQPVATLRTQSLTNHTFSFIQYKRISVNSFTVGSRPPAGSGYRYVAFTYAVRNADAAGTASSLARSNLTLIPVSINGTTLNTPLATPISALLKFDGSAADPTIASTISPIHGSRYDAAFDRAKVNDDQADLQIFSEAEMSSFVTASPQWPANTTPFPYGFVIRNAKNPASRTLPANPVINQYDGIVTFAFKVPLQTAATLDPFVYSIQFELAEDNAARVTKSNEESTATRARDLAATLGGTLTGGSDVCKLRFAGAAGAGNAAYINGLGLGAAGTADVCFNPAGTNPGRTTQDFTGGNDYANAVTVQPDGKSIVAGATSANGTDFAVSRFNTDGTLDSSFGTGGSVTTDFAGNSDIASSVLVQPDGKILVGGSSATALGIYNFALARYTSSGTLDSSFGGGTGKVTLDFSGGNDLSNTVMLQPDGKIVLAGYAFILNDDFALARFNSDGSVDTSFGTNGKTTLDFATTTDDGLAAVLQQDGKLVVAGYSSSIAGTNSNFALTRFNSNGSLDTSFGSSGKATLDFNGGADIITAITQQPDGKIIVAGYATESAGGRNIALVRYTTAGALDLSFNSTGKVTLDVASGTDEGYGVAIQPDGKIVVAGSGTETIGGKNMLVARYNSNGTLDSGFGTAGKTTLDFALGSDVVFGLALQVNGEILAVGSTGSGVASNFAVARFHP